MHSHTGTPPEKASYLRQEFRFALTIGAPLSSGLALAVFGTTAAAQDAATHKAAVPAPPDFRPGPGEAKPSVVVGDDHRVTFNLYAPAAAGVTVGGDFTMGAPPVALTKGANCFWSYTTQPLPPDSYIYNFTVDGVGVLNHSL